LLTRRDPNGPEWAFRPIVENAMRRLSLAVALLLIAPLACAQVFKWTDAHGTVHYSQTPPPSGTKYSRVTVTGTVEPVAQSNTAPSAEPASQDTPAPAGQTLPDTPDNRAKLCASLKSNLSALKGNGPVVMQVNGKQALIDATQRKQQIDTAQAQYQHYCAS
jgi:DNA polymerase III gamma/tau subunit